MSKVLHGIINDEVQSLFDNIRVIAASNRPVEIID